MKTYLIQIRNKEPEHDPNDLDLIAKQAERIVRLEKRVQWLENKLNLLWNSAAPW
jgi:hypothetical protein